MFMISAITADWIKILCHVFHLYTLDLSTNRFLQAMMNCWKKCRVFAGYHCLGCTQIFSSPPFWRWVSTQGPPTCMEPKVGSRKGQQSSETCSPPISPPDRRRRCPFIAQVRVTRNNFNVEHGYCLLLPILDLPRKRFVQRSIKRNDL